MTPKIDESDRKILRRVQIDASTSVEQLAEQVGLSRNACWRRVKALESAGLIKRRVALLDADQLDIGQLVYVLVRTSDHNSAWLAKFRDVVRNTPEIVGAHRMSGDLDYVLRVRVRDVKDYDRFYQSLIAEIPIADISASFVMEDIKDTTELPI